MMNRYLRVEFPPRSSRFIAGLGLALVLAAILCDLSCTRHIGNTPRSILIQLDPAWTIVDGGVIRGDVSTKQLALVFTGGDFGEGTAHILDVLHRQQIKASFFVTGGFLRNPDLLPLVKRAVADGHYVGPHSDQHPLYCPWDNREKSLVTEDEFRADLQKNIADLRAIGALADLTKPVYFIPPYEWYNADQSAWARKMNVLLFNFTPGSGSNRDWAPETEKSFVPSQQIMDDILRYEQKDPHGLNGFILLLHLGSARKDKPFLLLETLLVELKNRGYQFVRVDDLLPIGQNTH